MLEGNLQIVEFISGVTELAGRRLDLRPVNVVFGVFVFQCFDFEIFIFGRFVPVF